MEKVQEMNGKRIEGHLYKKTDIAPELLGGEYQHFLAAKVEGNQRMLIEELPRRAQIASTGEIGVFIGKSVRGVSVRYLNPDDPEANLPSALSRRKEFYHFALDTRSEFWEDIKESGSIAVYTPASLGEIEFELVALKG
jgi:predicted component of type VI protein secretion system